MSSLRKRKIERDIVLGFALLGAFLLIHRLISNKMIDDTDEK
jgi:hypothetical protein